MKNFKLQIHYRYFIKENYEYSVHTDHSYPIVFGVQQPDFAELPAVGFWDQTSLTSFSTKHVDIDLIHKSEIEDSLKYQKLMTDGSIRQRSYGVLYLDNEIIAQGEIYNYQISYIDKKISLSIGGSGLDLDQQIKQQINPNFRITIVDSLKPNEDIAKMFLFKLKNQIFKRLSENYTVVQNYVLQNIDFVPQWGGFAQIFYEELVKHTQSDLPSGAYFINNDIQINKGTLKDWLKTIAILFNARITIEDKIIYISATGKHQNPLAIPLHAVNHFSILSIKQEVYQYQHKLKFSKISVINISGSRKSKVKPKVLADFLWDRIHKVSFYKLMIKQIICHTNILLFPGQTIQHNNNMYIIQSIKYNSLLLVDDIYEAEITAIPYPFQIQGVINNPIYKEEQLKIKWQNIEDAPTDLFDYDKLQNKPKIPKQAKDINALSINHPASIITKERMSNWDQYAEITENVMLTDQYTIDAQIKKQKLENVNKIINDRLYYDQNQKVLKYVKHEQ